MNWLGGGEGEWYRSCLRPSELLDVNGRLAPDIYIELTGTDEQVKLVTHRKLARLWCQPQSH